MCRDRTTSWKRGEISDAPKLSEPLCAGKNGGRQRCSRELREQFEKHGNGWYLTKVETLHTGCVPLNRTSLSEEEESIIIETLLNGKSVGTRIAETIASIQIAINIQLTTSQA